MSAKQETQTNRCLAYLLFPALAACSVCSLIQDMTSLIDCMITLVVVSQKSRVNHSEVSQEVQRKKLLYNYKIGLWQHSFLGYNPWFSCRKMLHYQRDIDLLLHLNATVVTSSGHDYDGTILLTRDTLFIVGSAVDAIQQTLFIRDIDLQEVEEDNRGVAIVNQSVITKEEGEEIDGMHDSGDADRLRQFLRDARVQALEQMPSLDTSESNLTSPGQKFVLLVDPMLRRTLVLQFHSAKRNYNSET